MGQDYKTLLKPEVIRSVSGLSLLTRLIVDKYLSGHQVSTSAGTGMEFSQYRNYEVGDDLRLLDWKMLARSGQYYVKQSEIDTNTTIKFVIDSSRSMLHQENDLTKMDYARVLVASLAFLSQNQGDAVGLFAVNDRTLHKVLPNVKRQHFHRLLQELVAIQNDGKWPIKSDVQKYIHDRKRKELIFFITDLHQVENELISFIKSLKTLKNEVVVLHVMGKNELEFGYKSTVTFEDLETHEKIKIDPADAKDQYLKALEEMIKDTKNQLLSQNIGYQLFKLSDPLEEVLQIFLKKRNKIG